MSWYQSFKDYTHQGAITAGGVVAALCGIRFEPLTTGYGSKALPGQSHDPGQVCPECLRTVSAR